jgi:lactate dehydrogenase-like 2-hydroxyacid dehydrogenase
MAKVLITQQIRPEAADILRAAGHAVIQGPDHPLTKEELIQALKEHAPDAVICLLTDTIDADVFDAAPQAKLFANYAVGYDNINLTAAKERHVLVTNTPGVLTDTVAEFTVSLIFALAKRVVEADTYTRAGKYAGWGPLLLLGMDVRGKTLGIVGAGRIGSRVAEIMAKGVGMNVIYYDAKPNPDFEGATGARFVSSLDTVLHEADIVSLHVPLTPETKHLISAEQLARMKKEALLINTSRGPVVDEHALVSALKGGVIAGAALDVFEHEPALAEGLAQLPNVIITPHIASATTETRTTMATMAAHNVVAFLQGEVPPNLVRI